MDDCALIGLQNAQSHFGSGAFSRAVRSNQRNDLAAMDGKINIAHKPSPVAINAGAFQLDQWFPL